MRTLLLSILLCMSPVLALGGVSHHQAVADALPFRSLTQSPALTRDYIVGEWVTRNDEHGRDVEIFWIVRSDGTLGYRFVVDGVSSLGDPGTWTLDGDTLTEVWQRPFGGTGRGIARLERIDDNTMRLIIIDNGHPEYTGKVRIYRRRGGPQVS